MKCFDRKRKGGWGYLYNANYDEERLKTLSGLYGDGKINTVQYQYKPRAAADTATARDFFLLIFTKQPQSEGFDFTVDCVVHPFAYVGVFYDRFILGNWVIASGLVYPMFDKSKHVICAEKHGPGEYYISLDYGTINPTAMGMWRVYRGTATMVKEYYYDSRAKRKQKTDEEYYSDLEKFAEGYDIIRVIVDPSAASFKECIRRHGKFAVWDANNSVLDGIRLTATLLQAGRLKFDESCVNTFDEFAAYMWDEDAGEDAVIKESDHEMDAIRYFTNTIMRREVRATGV